MAQAKKLKVTLTGSKFGRKTNHAECIKGLGLRRMHHSVVIENTPQNRGMIDKVIYLLQVEEV